SRDSPVRNCAPVVWSFGPSRNDGASERWIAEASPAMTRALIFTLILDVEKSLPLHHQMHLVLERRVVPRRELTGIVGDRLAQGRNPGVVGLGEIGQDVVMHQFLDAGVTDPEPHPAIIIADM